MATIDYTNNNAFTHQLSPYDDSQNFAFASSSLHPSSPHFSSAGSADDSYTQLLEAFTHNNDQSPPQHHYNQGGMLSQSFFGNNQAHSSSSTDHATFRYESTFADHANPYLPFSAASDKSGLGFTDGLRIHPSHSQPFAPGGQPQSAASGSGPQSTVARLEAAAAAANTVHGQISPSFQPQTSDRVQAFNHQPQSRRSTLEGVPQIASLSLNSPHASVSASSSSSSQNSPTTPLSAHGNDSQHGMSLQQAQQQQLMNQNLYIHTKNLQQFANGTSPLSASLPPSFMYDQSRQPFNPTQPSPVQASFGASVNGGGPASISMSQSLSRLSSAGLMDQVVSSRRPVASPMMDTGLEKMESTDDIMAIHDRGSEDTKMALSRSARSTGAKAFPTPPSTPGRGALTNARNVNPLSQSISGVSQNTGGQIGQTPSSVGPHRTPSKRIQAMQNGIDALHLSPASANIANTVNSPSRPGMRRANSHTITPRTSRKGSVGIGPLTGLTSPTESRERIQQAAQFALASSMQPSQKARIASAANGFELDSGPAVNMMRAMSSPSYGNGNLCRPPSSSDLSSSVASESGRNRRSNTMSALAMSPMPHGSGPSDLYSSRPSSSRKSASTSPGPSVSYAEALLALDQICAFLDLQAGQSPGLPQQAALALGTSEQRAAITDIKQRIQNRLAQGIM